MALYMRERRKGAVLSRPIIERLERILARAFWTDESRRCTVDDVTIEISGKPGAFSWRIDAADGSRGGLRGPFDTVEDAKRSARSSLDNALRHYRERARESASTEL